MFDFTTEQVEFLESSGKVVLHACPGSGKTTIVARKLANYLQCWNRPHQGIAVLSFTNVASDEIRHQATEMLPEGYCVDDPHFIGTLDSFIDNFIFLRFGYLLQKKPKRPVITSPDVVNSYQFWRKSCYTNCLSHIGDFRWNSNGKLTKNGKDIICTGTQQYAPPCIQFKKRLLEKGLFFQDEVSGLACILLERYPEIAKSIALRFPVIILDEAQDTSEEQMRILDTYSSIHGVKGETFDALMLLIHGTVGNTLTPSFLANGKTNTELMRIAYVAMTRPRKLLVVAMPKNKAKLSNRFPPDKWDYVEL